MKFRSILNSKCPYFLETVLSQKISNFWKKTYVVYFWKIFETPTFLPKCLHLLNIWLEIEKIVIRSSEKRYAMAISCRVVRGSDWRHNMPLENNIIIGVGVLPTSLKIKNFEIFWDFNALIKLACFFAFGYITLVHLVILVKIGNFDGKLWKIV